MLPPKIAALYGEMEKVRGETLSALSGLTEEEFSRKAEGEWSAAQILHHILMAETATSKVIRKSIKLSAGTLPPYPADDSVFGSEVIFAYIFLSLVINCYKTKWKIL